VLLFLARIEGITNRSLKQDAEMSSLYRLHIDPSISLEQAWSLIELAHVDVLYGAEEEEHTELYVQTQSPSDLSSFPWIHACTPYTLPPIDWESQWAAHGHDFHEGYVHLDLSSFAPTAPSLRLQPGPGFGDLSHPTTRLLVRLLTGYLTDQLVVDVGCGSGILTLAAAALGAPFVYGIDIDQEALQHSQQNAVLNGLETQCLFCFPCDFIWKKAPTPILGLMNMIQSEQQVAWSSLPALHTQAGIWLTSGIRLEGRDAYLAQVAQWGWVLKEEQQEEEWLAFCFNLLK
jgi:ribosomal protein L11 methyltransferase